VNASPSRCCTVKSLLAVAALCAAPAVGQIYQRTDTIPIVPGGSNPPTNLQAVSATFDGGYIAVGREATTIIHLARYDAAGNVMWSRFLPTNFDAQATSINLLGGAANPSYVVAGEIADAFPWGAWTMIIDINGNMTCPMREINGVGPNAPASRSPVAVKPLADTSYVVTGRSQVAATAQAYARLTRFAPGCAGVMWSKIYTPTAGLPGLTGACEITDVVEEPGDTYLLAVGTAQIANNTASVPFLLRVVKATGVPVFAKFYGNGDPTVQLRGDGLAISADPTGLIDGYVFDGRSNSFVGGVATPTANYVVKVNMAGLNVLWGQTFRDVEPCHACVRTSGSNTLLAGTHFDSNNTPDVRGTLVDSAGGAQIWNMDYGQGLDHGNGVDITVSTPVNQGGPIIVGVGGTTALQSGYLVKSKILNGDSGGCQVPEVPPIPNAIELNAQFISSDVQNFRTIEFPYLTETVRTVNACVPTHPVCCNPDFNNDGDVGTDADIADFFACLAGSCCPTCGSADFNCDGDVGTDADIAAFFSVLGGGPC
jgi:hypothetical protein